MEPLEQQVAKTKSITKKRRPQRFILLLLFFLFIIIQFFQPDKNNNDVLLKNDITTMVSMPDTVQQLMKVACYDCHTNNTIYPWYSNIQPVGWWMNNHIEEGKRHLNFNEFATIQARNGKSARERQLKKLEEIKETIKEDEMPLSSYMLIHKDANLTEEQKQFIMDWSDSARHTLSLLSEK